MSITGYPSAYLTPVREAEKVFQVWLTKDYDLDILRVVLAVAAAEKLDGDPAWLLVVASPGSGKSETVCALGYMEESSSFDPLEGPAKPHALIKSSLTGPAALLSGSKMADRAPDAHGGILRQLGDSGVLVFKDFSSILGMHPQNRGEALDAFREIFDGHWVRDIGAEGGRSLEWRGRIVVIGAVTEEWDRAHAVMAAMGDRFALVRFHGENGIPGLRRHQALQAMANVGAEKAMRQELGEAATAVLDSMDPSISSVLAPVGTEIEAMVNAALLTTWMRTYVALNYRGEPQSADTPESATRFAKQLTQIFRGGLAIGLSRPDALRIAIRVGRDSAPPMRLKVLEHLAEIAVWTTPAQVAQKLDIPWDAAKNTLNALLLLGLATTSKEVDPASGDDAKPTKRITFRISDQVDLAVLDIDAATQATRADQDANRWRDLFRGNLIPRDWEKLSKKESFSEEEKKANLDNMTRRSGHEVSPDSASLPPQVHVFHDFATWLAAKADGADTRACAGVMVSDGRQPMELWESGFFSYDFATDWAESWFADLGLIDIDQNVYVELTEAGRLALAECESLLDAEAKQRAKPRLVHLLRSHPPEIDAAREALTEALHHRATIGLRATKKQVADAAAEVSRCNAELTALYERDRAEAEKRWAELDNDRELVELVSA